MRISDWSSDVCSSDLQRRKSDGQREQAAGRDILAGRDHRIAVGLWADVDDRARRRLGAVAEQGAAAAEQEGGDLPGRVGTVDEREREQRAAERADEAVDAVPDRIDPGDLVGVEFGERAERERNT